MDAKKYMKRFLILISAVWISENAAAQELKVYTNFENASATVLKIDSATQTLRIVPAGNPERGMPNWWYFRVEHIDTSRLLTLEVVAPEALVKVSPNGQRKKLAPAWTWPERAAWSTDYKTWKQSSPGVKHETYMLYQIQPTATTMWLAWGPPFTSTDAINLVDGLAKDHNYIKSLTLAQSLEGRRVPLLRICDDEKKALKRPAIWIQARQHAWEVGGTWVAAGLAHWLVSSDPQAIWLRQNAEIYIVPLMDVDHVATGDGGKNAHPHDHNRDWNDKPHWPEVASAQKYIQMLSRKNQLNIFLDLHNPAAGNKLQTLYVLDKSYMGRESFSRQQQFLRLMIEYFGEIKQNLNDPRPAVPSPEERVSEVWVLDHANPNTIAFCVETPWNSTGGTIDGYRTVGEKLGKVIEKMYRCPM